MGGRRPLSPDCFDLVFNGNNSRFLEDKCAANQVALFWATRQILDHDVLVPKEAKETLLKLLLDGRRDDTYYTQAPRRN